MTTLLRSLNQNKMILSLCVFFGIALQIQASIGVENNYSGLRINLGDLALPFAGLFVAGSLFFKKSVWPQWSIRYGFLWPILMSTVMIFALFNGYIYNHHFTHWALVNKFAGWLILMGYFLLGGWLVTNAQNDPAKSFLRALIITFLVLTLINLLFLIGTDISYQFGYPNQYLQLRGLMGNRTSYAFLLLTIISAIACSQLSARHYLPRWLEVAFWVLLPLLLAYNGSRAACIAVLCIFLTLGLLFRGQIIRPIFMPLLCGFLLIGCIYAVNPYVIVRESQNQSTEELVSAITSNQLNYDHYKNESMKTRGDLFRLRVFKDSTTLWKQSPIQGIGLGSFLEFEQKKYGPGFDSLFIIDSTPLWLLIETGIIGFLIFAGFGIFCIPPLWNGSRLLASDHDILSLTILLTGIGLGMMMMFHELLYSRHLWFALGLGLAQPKTR